MAVSLGQLGHHAPLVESAVTTLPLPPLEPDRPLRRRSRLWWAAVLACAAALGVVFTIGVRIGQQPHPVASPLLGHPAPPFVLPRLDRPGHVDSADLRASAYVVNFWASWCTACRRENSAFRSAYPRWQERGVEVVGVSFSDSASAAREFRRRHGGGWPLAADPSGRVAVDYGVTSVPSTFVIDDHGIVLAKLVGAVEPEDVDEILARNDPAVPD